MYIFASFIRVSSLAFSASRCDVTTTPRSVAMATRNHAVMTTSKELSQPVNNGNSSHCYVAPKVNTDSSVKESIQTDVMEREMPTETNDEDSTLGTTGGSPQRVSDRLPVLIPWTTMNVRSPCYVDCSPPVLSPAEVTEMDDSNYAQYSDNVGDDNHPVQNETNKEKSSSIEDIYVVRNTCQDRCESISDFPLDYSMKQKNEISLEKQTLNAEERKDVIENNCEPIAKEPVHKKESFLISDILGPKVGITNCTRKKRENLNQLERLLVSINQSESGTESDMENPEQSERVMVNTNQPESETLRGIEHSGQSERALVSMSQSEVEMMNEDQSWRRHFLSHSCDEHAVSETLLMLSGASYERGERNSVKVSMCHDRNAQSLDSWDSVSSVYSEPLPLSSSNSLKYIRSISADGRYDSKDAFNSCPVEANWSLLGSGYSDAEESYQFSELGVFEAGDPSVTNDSVRECVNGNHFRLSNSSYSPENVRVSGSNSEILHSYLISKCSGEALKQTVSKCPPKNEQRTEILIPSEHAHETKSLQFSNEPSHYLCEEKVINGEYELNALRKKLRSLLFVVLGQERLTRLGHPETDIDNILNTVLALAHVTPCQPREKSEFLTCLRVNIKELLLLCVPQEALWVQYGWKTLTVDEIMERLYYDEVLPYLQEVRRNRLEGNGERPSSLTPSSLDVQIDSNKDGQLNNDSKELPGNGSHELPASSSNGHTDVATDERTDTEMCKQVNSISDIMNDTRAVKIKRGRGRPRKRKIDGMLKRKRFFLWRFLLELLLSPQNNGDIKWLRKEEGIFQIVNSRNIARQWGRHQGNPNMNYEKMARAMRTYYVTKVLSPVPKESVYPKKLVYKFSPGIMKLLDDSIT